MRIPSFRNPILKRAGIKPHLFAALALLSALGGLAEAAVLVLVVQIAVRLAQTDSEASPTGVLMTDHWGMTALFIAATVLSLARLIAFTVSGWLGASLSARVIRTVREQLFGAYVHATWPTQSRDSEGQLQELSTTQMNYAAAYAQVVANVAISGVSFATVLASALIVNPLAAIVMVAAAVVLFVALRPLSRRAREQSRRQANETTAYGLDVSQSVSLALESRVFGVVDPVESRIRAAGVSVARLFFRSQLLSRLVPAAYQSFALLIVVGALWVIHVADFGPVSGIGAVVILLIRSLSYGQQLQTSYNDFQFYAPYAENVEQAITRYEKDRMVGGPTRLTSIDRLELEDVSYVYEGGQAAISDLSFSVERGEIIGIAGASGAGKTTLAEILLRLREPTAGSYLVNGVPAPEYDLDSWFAMTALVRQEPRLLTGTITENIRFFRDIDDPAIERAGEAASLGVAISERDEGYESAVGQRGTELSGGQRQRLTIARALAKSPGLVVMDEPTSALDVYTERGVHQALDQLRGKAYVFVIAHRLSTLQTCDRVLVLQNGRLEAFDTPAALSASNAFFKAMVASTYDSRG